MRDGGARRGLPPGLPSDVARGGEGRGGFRGALFGFSGDDAFPFCLLPLPRMMMDDPPQCRASAKALHAMRMLLSCCALLLRVSCAQAREAALLRALGPGATGVHKFILAAALSAQLQQQ